MLNTRFFGEKLKNYGFNFYSGVPCSFLKELINYAINDCEYIISNNEGDAIAICAGAYLGGRKSVVIMQNSGLTNAISPLTSLNYIFKIPILGFVSLRGGESKTDEPQHELTGKITTKLLDLMQIKWEYLSDDIPDAVEQLERANTSIENNQTFFFVVKKGIFEKEKLLNKPIGRVIINNKKITKNKDDRLPYRRQVLKIIGKLKDNNTLILTTTGFTSRELYENGDIDNNFYMVGSMGCVGSIALGLSIVRHDKKVVAIDGDGALLMRMGSMTTNAYYGYSNMLHILLDNNAYESTGGQSTVSSNIDFVNVAASLGYENSIYVHDLDELDKNIYNWKRYGGLTFIYIKIMQGTNENLGRPKIKPVEVKDRFMNFINQKI